MDRIPGSLTYSLPLIKTCVLAPRWVSASHRLPTLSPARPQQMWGFCSFLFSPSSLGMPESLTALITAACLLWP